METLETKSSIKVANVLYVCETCDYITSRKNNYDKHITTPKHHRKLNGNEKKHKSSTTFKYTNYDKNYYKKSYLKQYNAFINEIYFIKIIYIKKSI